MTREEKMMDAADAYAEEIYKDEPDNFHTDEQLCETINDFCAGWRAADSHPQWIPVEERLPDTDNCGYSDFFLVHDVADDDHVAYYNKMVNEWYTIDGVAIFVTHWTPIVPPRKEE